MSRFKSPLRYPGGKACLYSFIKDILYDNDLIDGIYAEPFAGGAGAALELLLHGDVEKILINDADRHIYAFWDSLLNKTEELIKSIINVDVTIEQWHTQRDIYNNIDNHTIFDIGFSTFFLNRTNRSGILKGRPIGGLDQSGKWKIEARFNKKELIKRIELIALYKNRINIFNKDAIDFINDDVCIMNNKKVFIYLDPPYYDKGGELYLNAYKHDDHVRLSRFIKTIPCKWMLSYDDNENIKAMYDDLIPLNKDFNYRAQDHKIGKEIIYFSNGINISPTLFDNIA